jgi:hypothetical protein
MAYVDSIYKLLSDLFKHWYLYPDYLSM